MSNFHEGELQAQEKAGVKDDVAPFAARAIRDHMPDQHRQFYVAQPMIIAALNDAEGHPWASPIIGYPGFIRSPDAKTLRINSLPLLEKMRPEKPGERKAVQMPITRGDKIGLLGIEFGTRRRNRINGVITAIEPDGFTVHVDQSFGNCPQYIQKRNLAFDANPNHTSHSLQPIATDNAALVTLLETADTFFIASRSAALTQDPRSGVDVSHRGGRPGFIKLVDENRLIFPDFSGNRFFNTLGNIVSDPRVGLCVPNFDTGEIAWLKGRATIVWDPEEIGAFIGAQRFIEINIDTALIGQQSTLISSSPVEPSSKLSQTGVWLEISPPN